MNINKLVGFIVSHPQVDHFSVIEIRTAYLLLQDNEELTSTEARKVVYSELVKLVKKGWLKKQISKKKKIAFYKKTELFDLDYLEFANSISFIPQEQKPEVISLSNESINELTARLHDHKTDLIEGLGEVEEYRTIRNEFPDLHHELSVHYQRAREINSRTLGKIKAIETLINTSKS